MKMEWSNKEDHRKEPYFIPNSIESNNYGRGGVSLLLLLLASGDHVRIEQQGLVRGGKLEDAREISA
jgi:hypothetical protein